MVASRRGLLVALAALWCSSGPPPAPAAERILFDTDMGSDCDDAGALALLHHYADRGEAEIVACVYSSEVVPFGAAVIEAINTQYGRADTPVGSVGEGDVGDPVDKMDTAQFAQRREVYGHRRVHRREFPDAVGLVRRLLSEEPDHSVTYLTVGHTKLLHDVLASEPDAVSPLSGEELVRRKLKRWVALGALRAPDRPDVLGKDWNLCANGTAPFTESLLESFPRPVVLVAAGTKVMTGASLKEHPPGTAVRDAYVQWLAKYGGLTLDDQRPSWDLAAVHYAVRGAGPYLEDRGRGRLEFSAADGYRWRAGDAAGPHRLIAPADGQQAAFAAYLNACLAWREGMRSSAEGQPDEPGRPAVSP